MKITFSHTDSHCDSYEEVVMDVEPNSDKIKINNGQICDNESLVDESKKKDHIILGNFEFVEIKDIRNLDTDVSSTIETIRDPIRIDEGMLIIVT